jgi:hypothetical protein
LVLSCGAHYDFYVKMMFGSSLHRFVLFGVHVLLMLFVFIIYVYWCPTRFPCQKPLCGLKSNMTGVTCGAAISNLSEHVPELNSRFLVGFVLLDL